MHEPGALPLHEDGAAEVGLLPFCAAYLCSDEQGGSEGRNVNHRGRDDAKRCFGRSSIASPVRAWLRTHELLRWICWCWSSQRYAGCGTDVELLGIHQRCSDAHLIHVSRLKGYVGSSEDVQKPSLGSERSAPLAEVIGTDRIKYS